MFKTPQTKRRLIDEKSKSVIHKLGPISTFVTLIKGFVATGVLYLPKSFVNGGWGFSILALIVSCICTTHCAMLLL
jgi:proton-coupled amino acid transporter